MSSGSPRCAVKVEKKGWSAQIHYIYIYIYIKGVLYVKFQKSQNKKKYRITELSEWNCKNKYITCRDINELYRTVWIC